MNPKVDRPSLGVVAAGGLGVLVVVAFVVALWFGSTSEATPGERVLVVHDQGPGGMAVLAGRCLDQRVRSVTVMDAAGDVLWRVVSRKGSIERRYVVGGGAPFGFTVERPLARRPAGPVRAEVAFVQDGEETVDARTVDAGALLPESDELAEGAPACGHDEGPGTTTVLFAVAAAFVLVGYAGMLLQYFRR